MIRPAFDPSRRSQAEADMTVRDSCVAAFDAHRNDCSGFACAVAAAQGVPLSGQANAIVDTLRAGGSWRRLTDGVEADGRASAGDFVIGGLRGDEQARPDPHGHIVVVIGGGMLAHGWYPLAWWGSLGGQPGKDQMVNFAWTEADRDRVTYAAWEPA
jgi:hypothetical protein